MKYTADFHDQTKCGRSDESFLKRIDGGLSDTDSETIISSDVLGPDTDTLYSNEDLECVKDLTVKAGNRLYYQAVDQHRRHEERRKEAMVVRPKLLLATNSPMGQRLRTVVSKKNQEILRNRPPKKKKQQSRSHNDNRVLDIELLKSAPVPQRCNQLYELSNHEQALGRQRRNLIEEEKARKKTIPETSVLPASRAGDMYTRSMERLIAQKVKLAALAQEMKEKRPYY
jgi:hypothetical protein